MYRNQRHGIEDNLAFLGEIIMDYIILCDTIKSIVEIGKDYICCIIFLRNLYVFSPLWL
jgi:hypothetical protein